MQGFKQLAAHSMAPHQELEVPQPGPPEVAGAVARIRAEVVHVRPGLRSKIDIMLQKHPECASCVAFSGKVNG